MNKLSNSESYVHDGSGNLTQHTDRDGNVDVFTYDGLNRRLTAGFGKTSRHKKTGYSGGSVTYTWDAGGRLTQAVDSIAGTISRSYDGLDDLLSETTPQGAVGYTYDNARRRLTMSVPGQSQLGYTWDDANRLTGITQGGNPVGFVYDNANRRTQLTLPNGVTVAYAYDQASRVAGLTYGANGTQLGNLTYAYDAAGRRVALGGSLAAATLPSGVSGDAFNADNAITGFNGTTLSYDGNGNLTGDGTYTYTWDARNHLTAIGGSTTVSFVYDAFDRRMAQTINGMGTQFLEACPPRKPRDGLNPVQDLAAGNPPASVTANLLAGLGIDDYFTRSDTSGTMAFLSAMPLARPQVAETPPSTM